MRGGGLIIINDRPCKYKIKSKSRDSKFTRNKGKAKDSRSGLSNIYSTDIIYRSTWPMCTQ